jgi:hypothetical protein
MKKDYYKIQISGCDTFVTTDEFKTLKDVQKELNTIKKLVKKGETLFVDLEYFMDTEFVVFNSKRYIYFKGNKRI